MGMGGPSRRDLLAAAGMAGIAGCGRSGRPARKPLVSAIRVGSYQEDLADIIRRILREHKVRVQGRRILLKPNLVEFDPNTCINTNPRLVAAAIEAFRSAGAAEVHVAEGPGHRRCTLDMADAAGYFEAIPKFESVFTDLNVDDVFRTDLRNPVSKLRTVYFPKTPFRYDLILSMPKLKTHHWVGATLSMKNFFGFIPGNVYGWPKNILHWSGIDECIVDLYRCFPSHFAIVDGIVGMEGNGPIQGTQKASGVLVAGADLVATDASCCRIMRIDPKKIRYLRLAEDAGQTNAANIQQIGERLDSVSSEFALMPQWRWIRG